MSGSRIERAEEGGERWTAARRVSTFDGVDRISSSERVVAIEEGIVDKRVEKALISSIGLAKNRHRQYIRCYTVVKMSSHSRGDTVGVNQPPLQSLQYNMGQLLCIVAVIYHPLPRLLRIDHYLMCQDHI